MLTTIIAIVGLVISLFTLFSLFVKIEKLIIKVADWIKRQREQDDELVNIRLEQSIIMVGVLACLKATVGDFDEKEIHDIIKMTEKHLNDRAHK